MKHKLVLAAILAIGLLVAPGGILPAAAQEQLPDPGVITVTGEAEIRVPPDEVVITLGVETSDKNLQTAKRQNDQIVRKVLDLARSYNIPSNLVQTDYMSIEPRYDSGYTRQSFVGYFVTKTVVVTLRDLTRFEGFLGAALEAGVNYVYDIQFRTTSLRSYRDEARAQAIRAAREKATALAAELGQQLGQPQSIDEGSVDWWSGYSWWGQRWGNSMTQNVIQEFSSASPQLEGSLSPGQISIRASVTVRFEFSPAATPSPQGRP